MYRFKLRQRAQKSGETVAHFVSALCELAKHCDYDGLEDGLIVDQLIERTSCAQLRERLLLEPDSMTLADAVVLGKQFETALMEARRFSRVVLKPVMSSPPAVQNVGQERQGLVRTATVLLCNGWRTGHLGRVDPSVVVTVAPLGMLLGTMTCPGETLLQLQQA